MSAVHGIDANFPVDWEAYRRSGVLFGGIKATEGTDFTSPAFHGNAEGTVAAGMGRMLYHYCRPGWNSPAAEAKHFSDVTGSVPGHSREILVADLETGGVHPDMRPADVSFWGWAFCTEVQRLRPEAQVKVYASPSFAEAGNCARLGAWPLWVAHWGVPSPVVPPPWKTWRIWQYAAGSNEGPDLDVFNGTPAEAERFFWSLNLGM